MLLALVVIFSYGAYLFISAALDPDSYKEEIAKQIETAIGRKVYVGKASVKFSKGIGINLSPVTILEEGGQKEIFHADSITTLVKIAPLLKREIQIKKVVLNQPVFHVRLPSLKEDLSTKDDETAGEAAKATNTVHKVEPLPGGDKKDYWSQIMHIAGGASKFYIHNGIVKIEDEGKSPISRITESIGFNLSVTKRPKANVLYNFELDTILKYRNNGNGTIRLKGGLTHIPKDLDFRKFGFFGEVSAKNIPQEVASFVENPISEISKNLPVRFGLEASFKGSPSSEIASDGIIRLTPSPGIYSKGSANVHSANLQYSALYENHSIYLKKFNLDFDGIKANGEIALEKLNETDPFLNLDLAIEPLQISSLKKNIYLKNLSGKALDVIGNHLKKGKVHLESIAYQGLWSAVRDVKFNEMQDAVNLRFSLIDVEGKVRGRNGPVAFRKGNGQFVSAGNSLNFEDVSFQLMGNHFSKLFGKFTNSEIPILEDISLESELNLEKLAPLLKSFFPLEKNAHLSHLENMKGSAHAALNFSLPTDDLSRLQYSGNVSAKNVSYIQTNFKEPFTQINGKMKFSSQHKDQVTGKGEKKNKNEKKQNGIFLDFEEISASYRGSQLHNLQGSFQKGNGEKGALSLSMKGLVDLSDFAEPIAMFVPNPHRILRDFKNVRGKAELDMKIHGEIGDLSPSGSLRLVNASLEPASLEAPLNRLNGQVNFSPKSLSMEDLKGELDESEFSLSGKVDHYLDGTPEFDLNLYLKGDWDSMKKLMRIHAGEKYSMMQDLSLAGMFKGKSKLKGTTGKIHFYTSLDLTDTDIQYLNKFKKGKGKRCNISIAGSYRGDKPIHIEKYEFAYQDDRVSGENSFVDYKNKKYQINLNTERFQIAGLLDLFNTPYDATLTGSVGAEGTLRNPRSKRGRPHFHGKIKLDRFGYHFKILPTPFKETNGRFFVSGEKCKIKSLAIRYGDSEVFLRGNYEGFEEPRYDLYLDSPRFQMDEILPMDPITILWLREFLSSSELFRKTDATIHINVQDGDFKFSRWKDLRGLLTIRNKEFYLSDAVASLPGEVLHGSGHIGFLSDKGMDFLLNIDVKSTSAEKIMYVIGEGFDKSLGGKLSLSFSLGSEGYTWDEVRNGFYGNLALQVKDGYYYKNRLLNGLDSVINYGDPYEKRESGERMDFSQLGGEFDFHKGTAFTKNYTILTKTRNTSMTGKLFLGNYKLDLSIGVAPWAEADKIVSQIPLVGSILTGGDDKSLLISYYKIEGDMSDPQIKAMPLKSIGKKFEGIFKGIFTAPQDLTDLFVPEKKAAK